MPFKQIGKAEIPLVDSNTTLYIIGNGFDMMHGVPSSYYNFRDTIGKNNMLRFTLLTQELPKRFRKWINTLLCQGYMSRGRFACHFLQEIYGVRTGYKYILYNPSKS